MALTITVNQPGEDNEGLQITGLADTVSQVSPEMINKHIAKRSTTVPHKKPVFDEDLKIDPEMSWYKLTPKKIELIYEKYYEFEKQVLELNKDLK